MSTKAMSMTAPIREIVEQSTDSKTIFFLEARRVENLFKLYDAKQTDLAKVLLKLRDLYTEVFGKKRGFPRWAADRFKRSEGNINYLLWIANHTDEFRRRELVRTQAKTNMEKAQEAFKKLDKSERNRFLLWATNL